MTNSKILKILAVLMAVAIVAGCGGNTNTDAPANSTESQQEQTISTEESMDFLTKKWSKLFLMAKQNML